MAHITRISLVFVATLALFTNASAQNKELELGREVARTVLKGVRSELESALQRGGPADAVGFCHNELTAIVKKLKSPFPESVRVRRTALRVRNPANLPDAEDLKAISYFEARSGEELLVPESGGVRYYAPIRIQPICLTCHGPKETLPPELNAKLREHYPNDQATGYGEGDLRGVIVVHVPEGKTIVE